MNESLFSVPAIGIYGLGLIGGSIAAAMKQKQPSTQVIGLARRAETLNTALNQGIIDWGTTQLDELTQQANVIIVATPIAECESIFTQLKPYLDNGGLVTDVASVKTAVIDMAQGAGVKDGYVPTHPIAGSEKSGIEAANADLFQGTTTIITPTHHTTPQSIECITSLWNVLGARVIQMSATEHDMVLAATSHLPHALAFTFMNALIHLQQSYPLCAAGGGFVDFTRIAASEERIWTDILRYNRASLLHVLDLFEHQLKHLRTAVSADDQTLPTMIHSAKNMRQQMEKLWITS